MTEDLDRREASILPLLAAPILTAAAIAIWAISDRLLYIGPFDRAQIGWAVVVPLFLLAPAAAALAAGAAGRAPALLAAVGTAVAIGGLVVLALSATATRIGCEPVSQGEAALHAVPVSLAAGAGFFAAVAAGIWRLDSGRVVAAVTAIGVGILGGIVTLLVFGATYPGVTCTPA